MKLLFILVIIGIIGTGVYFFSSKKFRNKKQKRFNWKPAGITASVVFLLLCLLAFELYKSAIQPDIQCATTHPSTSQPPHTLQTANDYFTQGDYDYELGNCKKAIADYTQSINLNPTYAQAYNNRAYTNMRMRNYKDALPDLDKAMQLKPNYIQALMNRGDIHNYYYQIDRLSSIKDYQRVIALGGNQQKTSVCGHLFLAKHNGWTLGAYLDYFTGEWAACK